MITGGKMDNWLERLSPGDYVILHTGFNHKEIAKVKRTTKTQVIILRNNIMDADYEQKFSKNNGFMIGSHGFHRSFLSQATPEKIDAVREAAKRSYLLYRIRDFDWARLATKELEAVMAVTDKYN